MSLFIGHNIIKLNSVDSTNSYAGKLLKESKVPEGTIIIAENQIEGRGQQGNKWIAEGGKDLTCSVILFPAFLPVNEQFYLTKAVACAVADFVAEVLETQDSRLKTQYSVKIKWPNDIYVNDKKIAGILIENSLRGDKINNSIIGIGININSENFEKLPNATSLKKLTGKDCDIKELMKALSTFLEARYFQLRSLKYAQLDEDYMKRLYRFKEWNTYKTNIEFQGKIVEITKDGKLVLELETGERKEFGFKEVSFI